jgi:hypothetical protein
MLAGLGSIFLGSAALAHDHDEGHHHRWDGREWNHREWDRHDWDRRYYDRAGRRRYWDGRGWVYLLPPPPHVGWRWDPDQGRYCP